MAKLDRLIQDGKAKIVVPELIRTEWDGCKEKIVKQITDEIVETRRSAVSLMSFMDEFDWTDVRSYISSVDPTSRGATIGAARIQAIKDILDSDATIRVPVSDQTKALAIQHALQKKAPFRLRNSMADALIFLTVVEWVNATKPDKAVFVSHNTKDFSDDKHGNEDIHFKDRLAPDLRSLIDENELEYGIIVGRVLNDIEQSMATEEEIEQGETVVERTRALDDLLTPPIADALRLQDKLGSMKISESMADALRLQDKLGSMKISESIADALRLQDKLGSMKISESIADALRLQDKLGSMKISESIADAQRLQDKLGSMKISGSMADALRQCEKLQQTYGSIDPDETDIEDDSIDNEDDDREGAGNNGVPGME